MVVKNIETGVDKLVSLIAKKKDIGLNEAAKELGVSSSVLREWAEFLEEEGIISIEYGISKITLSEKKLTKKEAESKIKDYHSKKDAFVRKVETTIKLLERETKEFDVIKEEFEDLKKNIGSEMEDVKKELEELRHYEDLKQNVDNDIRKQKVEYLELINKSRTEIKYEENKFLSLIQTIRKEKDSLVNEKKEVLQLEEKEDHLRKRLEAIYGIIKSIENKVETEKGSIEGAEKHIAKLEGVVEKIESNITKKKKEIIEPLLKKSQEHADKISTVQDSLLNNIKNKELKLDKYSEDSKKISERFRKFFDKKIRTEHLMGKIDEDKQLLKDQLELLIKKAQAFDALAKKTSAKNYIQELMKTYDQIETRKGLLRKKLEQLTKLVRGE